MWSLFFNLLKAPSLIENVKNFWTPTPQVFDKILCITDQFVLQYCVTKNAMYIQYAASLTW